MFVEIFLLLAILVGFYCIVNSRRVKNLPPGPSPIFPFVGNIPQLVKYRAETSYQTFDKLVKDYGPVVYIQIGKIAQVTVQDLTLAKQVLSSEVWVDRVFDELIGERSWGKPLGIIFTWGDVWKEMRRFTMRTLRDFGFGKQKSMESVLDEEISLVLDSMDKYAKSGEELAMHQHFTVSILNILWSMVAGFRFSHEDARLKKLINLIDETSRNNPAKAGVVQAFPFLWPLFRRTKRMAARRIFIEELHKFFKELLESRRKDGSYREGEPQDFVDAFLQQIDAHEKNLTEPNFYTDEQFIMVTYDLFVAGAETTSNTLEFAMLYMALNPRVQVKVQEEIDRVVGSNKKPTLDDRQKMPYTEATILEIQRMANVLPIIIRGNNQDTSIAGYHIPKGTIVGISVISLHNCKKTWGDPKNFRPERFLDADNNIINANKLLSFGLGKRVCLGEVLAKASLFTYFSSVLQRYTLQASPNHPPPSYIPLNGFTLSPQEYFLILNLRQ